MRFPTPLVVLVALAALPVGAQPVDVRPAAETQVIVRGGSATTDIAFWPNSGNASRSLLVVADSAVGVVTYGLDGEEVQALQSDGVAWGVDVRSGFDLPGGSVPIVVVANGTLQSLTAYVVDPVTRGLRRVDTGSLRVAGFEPRSVTLYRSPSTDRLYAFMASATGNMQQLELRSLTDGGVEGVSVRSFVVGGAVVGAVADDQQGALFVAQQNTGIWRYSAEPDGGTRRTTVATANDGVLTAPLGGLALYTLDSGEGYLLAASEGGDQVAVYNRFPPHASEGSFRVVADAGIDAVTGPRALEATPLPLGTSFPGGLVALHDAINDPIQNYKLVSWNELASTFSPPLQVNNPGSTDGGADGGTSDGGTDGGRDGGGGTVGPPPGGTTFPPGEDGCGCTAASVPGTVFLVVAGLVLLGRRRRQV
jgi:3-phytase